MTMPSLMNCSHQERGWCLDCVDDLNTRLNRALRRLSHSSWVRDNVETPCDGSYLCYIEQKQECGTIHSIQRVVVNRMNRWVISDNEIVTHWMSLPSTPSTSTK